MKKIIIILFLIIGIFQISKNNMSVMIPNEAIRFRIIANSNSENDQNIKIKIRDNIQKELYNDVINTKTVEEARKTINSNLNKYKNIIESTEPNINYTINYGENYFPKKTYKGVDYNEGSYESLVVSIGEGIGDNWWCVLFPPLCLLEAEENEESTEVEYKSYIIELIDKYF